jgi:hypothetical protein
LGGPIPELRGLTRVNSLVGMANEDDSKVRAVAKIPEPPQQRGVAKVTAEAGQRTGRIYWPVPERRPVFVDDTGRRSRRLSWLFVLLAVAGLALVIAFWVSQVGSAGA